MDALAPFGISVRPYFHDAKSGVAIYHADARDILPQIADTSVDLVLTDPPYGIAYETNRIHKHQKMRKAVANDETLEVVAAVWPEAMRLLRDNRHWYAFASPKMIGDAGRIFQAWKQVLCWDKGDRGTVGDLECGFGEAWEAIFYGMKGRRPLAGSRPRTVIRFDWSASMDPVHPTVKPKAVIRKLIAWSASPGELILDPFMGSGTTVIAAKDCGCRAIGIEVEERYCAIAAERLRQGSLLSHDTDGCTELTSKTGHSPITSATH